MGKGKPTARSQNYLRQYGYPSARELRREAQGLASASVPTVRSVQRPYERQLQSSRDFLAAVQAALRDTSAQVGTGYDTAISQSQGVDQAAQQRLAGLGLTPEAAVAQAGGDNATQNLIANSAAAKNYAAQLPGIAAGQAYVGQQGINKNLTDALANRRDQLSQAFFQALQQVQGQALQQASFNQQAQGQQQNLALQYAQMGQQASEFAQSQQASRQSAATSAAQWRAEYVAKYGIDPYTGKPVKGASGVSGDTALAQGLGITTNELYGYRSKIATEIDAMKAGVPWDPKTMQGTPITLRDGSQWKIPPAPNGAANEPNQPNSIFQAYRFLAPRFPHVVVLQSLAEAYPNAWKLFRDAMFPQPQKPISPRAARRGRGPISGKY